MEDEKEIVTLEEDNEEELTTLEEDVGSGSGTETNNYNDLSNKPKINNVELSGNKTLEELGIKQEYTAEDITFEDGQTFQEKYDNGELKGEKGETGLQGEPGIDGKNGTNGEDGFSPQVSIIPIENGNKVSITDKNGLKQFDVFNGVNGQDGQNGVDGKDGKNYSVEIVEDVSTTLEIQPNKFYKFGELSELNLTLAEITNNTQLNEFMFEFVSGATATTLTLPSSVKWLETPTIEANKTYQCSIVNNIGILVGVANV